MAKVMKRTMEVFPPSDRELALRAQIKTGWSTISSHDHHQEAKLTEAELKQIQQVLERAQAMERMEEIRVGLQILRHKKLVEKCRGDGVTACRICNRDISNKRSSRPEPIQFCSDCQMVVCSRCRVSDKFSGSNILCTVCYEERELWKKSGSWLNNSQPNVSISEEDLEEMQQQMSKSGRSGRHREGSLGFVSPYQLEVEDQDDDDDDETRFTPSPSGSQQDTSSATNLLKSLKAASKDLEFDLSPALSDPEDPRPRANSDGGGRIRSRSSGLSRHRAISKADKSRLLSSRERARSRYRSGSQVPGPSLTSAASSSQHDPLASSLPAIKVRKPSTQGAPMSYHSQSMPRETQPPADGLMFGRTKSVPTKQLPEEGVAFGRTKSVPTDPQLLESTEDSGSESGRSYIIKQMHDVPSSDSDIMTVEGMMPESLSRIDVEESIRPGMVEAYGKQIGNSPSSSPEMTAVHQPQRSQQKIVSRDQSQSPAAEFRKAGVPAAHDEFKKIGGALPPQDEFGVSAGERDEFKKIGGLQDEFKKIEGSPPAVQDEFKRIGAFAGAQNRSRMVRSSSGSSESKQVGDIDLSQSTTTSVKAISEGGSNRQSYSAAGNLMGASDFRKVQSPPRSVELKSSKDPEIVKSSPLITAPRHRGKASSPPRSTKSDDDEFKKIPSKETKVETVMTMPLASPPKRAVEASTPPRNSGRSDVDEFKKVPVKEAQVETVATIPLASALKHVLKASSPPRSADVSRSDVEEFKQVSAKPTAIPRNRDASRTDTDEFKKVQMSDVKSLSPTSPPGQTVKPVARKRVLLPSHSLPPQNQPVPMQRASSAQKAVIRKQNSTSSVRSEGSAEVDVDLHSVHSTDSFTSLASSGSGDGSQPRPDDEHRQSALEPRGLTRRNAHRSTNRRPLLQPRGHPSPDDVATSDDSVETPPTEDADNEPPNPPKMRSRSGVIKRPAGRRAGFRGELSSGGSSAASSPRISSEDRHHATLGREDMGEQGEGLRPARGSSLSNQDRLLARRARDVTQQRREQGATTTPSYKPDGQFGSIRFTLLYDESRDELKVTVHSCKGLRAMDKSGLSDPYVKLFLQPRTKFQKFRTRTILKNLNPTFDESFTFTGLPKELIEKRKLCAVVMDQDELSKDDLIGGTQVNLYEILAVTTREICMKRLLDDRSVPKQELVVTEKGMIHLKIQYSLETEELVVSVLGTKDLDNRGVMSGVYVKCLWTGRSHCVKVKTKISSNLQFAEDLYISTGLRDLMYSILVVGVWEHRSFKDKQLGEVQFNSVSFWKGFSVDPSKVVMDWYLIEAPSLPTNKTATLPRMI